MSMKNKFVFLLTIMLISLLSVANANLPDEKTNGHNLDDMHECHIYDLDDIFEHWLYDKFVFDNIYKKYSLYDAYSDDLYDDDRYEHDHDNIYDDDRYEHDHDNIYDDDHYRYDD